MSCGAWPSLVFLLAAGLGWLRGLRLDAGREAGRVDCLGRNDGRARLVEQLTPYRRGPMPVCCATSEEAPDDSKEHLHASLALLPVDDGQVEYLYERLLDAEPQEVAVIRDALQPHKERLAERLWGVLEDTKADPEPAFPGGVCPGGLRPDGRRRAAGDAGRGCRRSWPTGCSPPCSRTPAISRRCWGCSSPSGTRLIGPLSEVFRSRERAETERSWATNILAEYASDRTTCECWPTCSWTATTSSSSCCTRNSRPRASGRLHS